MSSSPDLTRVGEYRLRRKADGAIIGRNWFEDRSLLPKLIVVHDASLDDRIEAATRWTWTPSSTFSTADQPSGSLKLLGWVAGPHESKIKAHHYDEWIDGGARGAQVELITCQPGGYLICHIVRGEKRFWGISSAADDVKAHIIPVNSNDAVTFTLENITPA
ncbi:hypothetical protein OC846_001584 [Tilletia horrida]|uniref:Uncharacterized protein n=1 Tax=Tilletia horrida TaxID=155126 RepID=A0AAN6GT02_9BASI|nr:hypothetical protein OC846_001584 [Tilletia horrida]KAK0569490.1 hypothetical protein OC861_000863 [Tilletia horrida]